MQENVGTRDRWLRVGIGSSLALAGVSQLRRSQVAPAVMLATGALILESAVTRVCPVNALLGKDTRSWDREPRPRSRLSRSRVGRDVIDEDLLSTGVGEDG